MHETLDVFEHSDHERHSEIVAAERAVAAVEKLSRNDFATLEKIILQDISPLGEFHGANEGHVRQVHAIGMKIARESDNFQNENEQRLVSLMILLHDIKKKAGPENPANLVAHAHLSAEEIPRYLANIDNRKREFIDDPLKVPDSLASFLESEEGQAMALFIARTVETHSAIPYIEKHKKFDFDMIQNMDVNERPFLKQTTLPDGRTDYTVLHPVDKYGDLLRAADTLSNYGIIHDLKMPLWEGADPALAKYSGFLKIIRLNMPMLLSEEFLNVYESAKAAYNDGVYDNLPAAKAMAFQSARRAYDIAHYFEGSFPQVTIDGDTIEHNDLEIKRYDLSFRIDELKEQHRDSEAEELFTVLRQVEGLLRYELMKAFQENERVDASKYDMSKPLP